MAYDEFILASQPNGAQRSAKRFWFRLLENFFRHKLLCIVPLLLIVGAGVYQASKVKAQYKSIGVVNVADNALLSSLTTQRGSDVASYETPSQATTRQINELLRTDQFTIKVLNASGMDRSATPSLDALLKVRSNVSAVSTGNRLLAVTATSSDPTTSFKLAQATINQFMQSVLDVQIKDSTEAAAFWSNLVTTYQAEVNAAEKATSDWIKANPAPAAGTLRSFDDQLQLQRLNDDITRAQAQVTDAQNKVQDANLLTQQSKSSVGEGLQVVDQPTTPTAPEPIKTKRALMVAIYLILGLLIIGSFVMISTLFDRSVRSAEDIRAACGLDVVATVPTVGELSGRGRRGKSKTKRPGSSLATA